MEWVKELKGSKYVNAEARLEVDMKLSKGVSNVKAVVVLTVTHDSGMVNAHQLDAEFILKNIDSYDKNPVNQSLFHSANGFEYRYTNSSLVARVRLNSMPYTVYLGKSFVKWLRECIKVQQVVIESMSFFSIRMDNYEA